MSQKPCRSCGHMVSTDAPSCPRCRVANPTHSWLRRNVVLVLVGVGVAVAAGVLLTGRGSRSADQASPAPTARVYHVGDSAQIRTGPGPEHPVARVVEPGGLVYAYPPAEADQWLAISSGESATDTVGFVPRDLARVGMPPSLLVIRHDTIRQEGNRYVVGLARNTTDSTFTYAYIQLIELRRGQMMGVGGIASVNDLGPHQFWQWRAMLSADSADSYEIFDVHTETTPRPNRP